MNRTYLLSIFLSVITGFISYYSGPYFGSGLNPFLTTVGLVVLLVLVLTNVYIVWRIKVLKYKIVLGLLIFAAVIIGRLVSKYQSNLATENMEIRRYYNE